MSQFSRFLVLASGSPRRREMLAQLGLAFEVCTSDTVETPRPDEAAEALVQRLAREKAASVASRRPGSIVIGADTVVVLEGQVLGKPADSAEAIAMLRALRGRSHLVLSAVCAIDTTCDRQASALNQTTVLMRRYDDEEIAQYVASGDPLDKAGAYAIQHRQFAPVEHIDGCYAGVMGFPLADVVRVLRALGVSVQVGVAAACEPSSGRCCQRAA